MIIKILNTYSTYKKKHWLSTVEAQIWGFSKHSQAQPKKGVAYKKKVCTNDTNFGRICKNG